MGLFGPDYDSDYEKIKRRIDQVEERIDKLERATRIMCPHARLKQSPICGWRAFECELCGETLFEVPKGSKVKQTITKYV